MRTQLLGLLVLALTGLFAAEGEVVLQPSYLSLSNNVRFDENGQAQESESSFHLRLRSQGNVALDGRFLSARIEELVLSVDGKPLVANSQTLSWSDYQGGLELSLSGEGFPAGAQLVTELKGSVVISVASAERRFALGPYQDLAGKALSMKDLPEGSIIRLENLNNNSVTVVFEGENLDERFTDLIWRQPGGVSLPPNGYNGSTRDAIARKTLRFRGQPDPAGGLEGVVALGMRELHLNLQCRPFALSKPTAPEQPQEVLLIETQPLETPAGAEGF